MIGNYWGDCDPDNPKNRRTRSSIHVETDELSILIDTGTDFRDQCNRENLKCVDAVLYTHAHSDHINGIDDLRYMAMLNRRKIPVYGHPATIEEIYGRFSYLFTNRNSLYKPLLLTNTLDDQALNTNQALDIYNFDTSDGKDEQTLKATLNIDVIYQNHGQTFSLGYRFGDFAYSTDVSHFSQDALDCLKGIKTWIVDCGQFGQDFTEVHPNFDMVLDWNSHVKAENVILTHLPVRADYDTMINALPNGYTAAYDGMKIEI